MLVIRLQTVGRRNQRKFRIIVTEHNNSAKKGKITEILGSYNPKVQPKELRLNKERYEHHLKNGAQPSKTVSALYEKIS